MSNTSTATILFVDDDPCLREVMSLILSEEGYDVVTAADGLEALGRVRECVPDLILCDLHMPRMSGVEFLWVVRRRFPAIPVIAISGAYDINETSAAGVMADAFYPKGRCHPDELLRTIRELMYTPLKRPTNYHPSQPPAVQVARNGCDNRGVSTMLLTCTDCLRAFSLTSVSSIDGEELHAHCPSCKAVVQFTCEVPAAASLPGVMPAAMQAGMQLG